MAKGRVDRKELYRMICALSDADVQKAVSYVSFLRFVDISQGRDLAELLKGEPSPAGPTPSHAAEEHRLHETTVPAEAVRAGEPPVEAPKPKFLKPETETFKSETSKGVYDVGDFYAPVRSPRLEQAGKPEDATRESRADEETTIPRLMRELEESVHSIFDADGDAAASHVSPFDYERHDHKTSPSEPAGETPVERARTETAAFAGSSPSDDFFMPVRSERLDRLRRPTAAEPEAVVFTMPAPAGHDEPEESSMFHAEPEHIEIETPNPPEAVAWPDEASGAPEPEALSEEERQAALVRERLRRLLMSFRLTYDGMAELFDAPTPIVYSWFDGTPWDSGQEARLEYYLEVADRVEKADVPRPDLAFRRPFASGETFLDKLKRQKVTGQDIKMLKDIADRSEELRHRPKGATKPFCPFEETIALYSTPLYSEAE